MGTFTLVHERWIGKVDTMKKSEFKKLIRNMMQDIKDGYYGKDEMIEEIWSYIRNEQQRSEVFKREVIRLTKILRKGTKKNENNNKTSKATGRE